MTQEHFLLRIANQAINEQSSRIFFQEYDNIQDKWPWQDSAEYWVDHILSFATKPEMMSVFLDPETRGGGKLYFRVDGRVLPGPHFTAEQYHQLLAAIKARVVFSQSVVGQLLREGFIFSETGEKHWVGLLQTVAGIQLTLYFALDSLSPGSMDDWPKQARDVVEQMQKHPNGLMLFCHRGWSLSRQDTIFNVLNSLINKSSNELRVGCVTESLQTFPPYENLTHLCVDGSQQSWEQASRALVAQDIDVVLMRGRNEKEVVTQAILTALEDRCVLVDVSHLSVIDTLLWLLTELPVSSSQIASVLLGVVGSYPGLRQVCPHCLTQREPDERLLALLAKRGISLVLDGNWVQGQGCAKCFGIGYMPKRRLTIVEAAYIDQSLANLCIEQPSKDRLNSALIEGGFQTYFEQAFQFAQQGMTTLQEALRVGLARRAEL
jgi:hypothetical protein